MSANKPNKPKQVSWFNGCGGRIGVVVGLEGEHAYIGAALCHDEDSDVAHILKFGAKFPLAAALLLPVSKSYSEQE
ncbi:MAG: hypothetical protein M0P59_12175 [Gallionella sp.]|jgi:hypothetical protein|nr:hypothetical protein [Gallionella sp.]MCK9354901.1 hypothetical protein [Gallionella sp.]